MADRAVGVGRVCGFFHVRSGRSFFPYSTYNTSPFEVLAFGVVDAHRVVGGLRQLVQDAYVAARDGRSREDHRAEQLLRHRLRAGEREEDAAGTYLRNGAGVEALVALHGITQHLVVFGEGRWVEDDQVVFVFDVLEVLHGIGGRFRKVGLRAEVEFHVFRGQHDGAFRRVHRADLLGAPSHGIDREAPV